jgi:hypothetical protein
LGEEYRSSWNKYACQHCMCQSEKCLI